MSDHNYFSPKCTTVDLYKDHQYNNSNFDSPGLRLIYIILTIINLLFLNTEVSGQATIGLSFGTTYNHLKSNLEVQNFSKNQFGLGYYIAAGISQSIIKEVAVSISPTLLQKNYKVVKTGNYDGIYDATNSTYLQLPLILTFNYGKRINLFFETGGYVAYWIKATRKGMIPDIYSTSISSNNQEGSESLILKSYKEKHQFDSNKENRIEWGLAFGTGLSYPIKTLNRIFIKSSYFYALTKRANITYINMPSEFNRTLSFSIGISHQL